MQDSVKANSLTIANKQPSPRQVPTQNMYYFMIYLLFSGLSLVLKKEGLWLTKMDTQPERTLRWATHRRQELIHTSCRSESSNISLVVLDKEQMGVHSLSTFSTPPEHSNKTMKWQINGHQKFQILPRHIAGKRYNLNIENLPQVLWVVSICKKWLIWHFPPWVSVAPSDRWLWN